MGQKRQSTLQPSQLLAVSPLSEKQIDFFLNFPLTIVEVLSNDSLPSLNCPRGTSHMLHLLCPGCAITTHRHKTQVNDKFDYSLVPPSPLLYFHRALQESRPWCQVRCSPEHPLHCPKDSVIHIHIIHIQCNSYTAFSSLVFDWFSLLVPVILFLYKVRRNLLLWVIHFLQASSKSQERTNKEDDIWKRKQPDFRLLLQQSAKKRTRGEKESAVASQLQASQAAYSNCAACAVAQLSICASRFRGN